MHTNSLLTFRKHALSLFRDGMKILELGPENGGRSSYLRAVRESGINNLDYWTANVRHDQTREPGHVPMLDAATLDCESQAFDVVLAANVLEHVDRPWNWVPELCRVTKLGGYVILVAPLTWKEHRIRTPYGRRDCWRVMPDGMRSLFAASHFTVDVVTVATECLDHSGANNAAQLGGCEPTDIIGIARRIDPGLVLPPRPHPIA